MTDLEKMLAAAVASLAGGYPVFFALYRRLAAKWEKRLEEKQALLEASAAAHRETVERLERAKDKVETEFRAYLDRLLDAAYSAKRGTPMRAPKPKPIPSDRRALEDLDAKKIGVTTLIRQLTPAELEVLRERLPSS